MRSVKSAITALLVSCLFVSEIALAAFQCYSSHDKFGEFVGYGQSKQAAYLDSYNTCRLFVPYSDLSDCQRSSKSCNMIRDFTQCYFYNSMTDQYFLGKGADEKQSLAMAKLVCEKETQEDRHHCHKSYIKMCQKEV